MFSDVVRLYRAVGRPAVRGESFTYQGPVTQEIDEAIAAAALLPMHLGGFAINTIDDGIADIEFNLPASDFGRFHDSVDSFVKSTPSLNFGEIPREFYIGAIDYYSGDLTHAALIDSLGVLCSFIRALSALASESAVEGNTRSSANRLLFVVAADGKSPAKTLTINVKVSEPLLALDLQRVRLIELLVSDEIKTEIHIEERRSIMRLAIAETVAALDQPDDLFAHLVTHWRETTERYRHNVLAFVNQYSFEKVRKEIATAQIDHATKLSAVLGDIGSKLLALPVSFAAVLLLRKAAEPEEFLVIALGLVTVTVVFLAILLNQWLQVKRLKSSFELSFGQYKEGAFPTELRRPIEIARSNIAVQYRVLLGTFVLFSILAIVPSAAALYVWLTSLPIHLIDACLLLSR